MLPSNKTVAISNILFINIWNINARVNCYVITIFQIAFCIKQNHILGGMEICIIHFERALFK